MKITKEQWLSELNNLDCKYFTFIDTNNFELHIDTTTNNITIFKDNKLTFSCEGRNKDIKDITIRFYLVQHQKYFIYSKNELLPCKIESKKPPFVFNLRSKNMEYHIYYSLSSNFHSLKRSDIINLILTYKKGLK